MVHFWHHRLFLYESGDKYVSTTYTLISVRKNINNQTKILLCWRKHLIFQEPYHHGTTMYIYIATSVGGWLGLKNRLAFHLSITCNYRLINE